MGLGYGHREWEDYEWFPSGGGRRGPAVTVGSGDPDGASAALLERVLRDPIWEPDDAPRILLVDLDNLRAGPLRWRARMAVVVALARQADHVALAGQEGAVRRARPHLEEFAGTAVAVAAGSDLADVALLAKVDELDLPDAQALVVGNDGIFAELAQCGPLVVLSPGRHALSDALEQVAVRVVDLAALEHDVAAALPVRTGIGAY
ncbi:MAG: hypothetical protein ACR2J0_05755 [Mycobacteriales bacterium]